MNTVLTRLTTRVLDALLLLALANGASAQNQPVTPPAIQPATVPAPMAIAPRTGNPVIQPLNPPRTLQGQVNPGATATPGGSPSAATTFQMQTPNGGSPQSVGSATPRFQQMAPQAAQRPFAPTNGALAPTNLPLGTANTPLGNRFGNTAQSAFVPAFVPTAIVFDPSNSQPTIQSLDPTGLYYESGLRQGDTILSSNGVPIQTQADFERLATANPNQPLPLLVRREGREMPIEVRPRQGAPGGRAHLGVRFDLDVQSAAMISSVTPGSPAEAAGLRPGDIITIINGEPITSYQQVFHFLAALRPGNQLDIRFTRRVENQTRVTLDSAPRTNQSAAAPPRVPGDRIAVPPSSPGQAAPR